VAMVRRHWRQADLANALNTNEAWLSRRLAGKTDISPDDLQKIAAALEVPVINLLPRWAFEVQAPVAGGEVRMTTGQLSGVPVQRTPGPGVRPLDTAGRVIRPRPTGVAGGYRDLTERPHDRRPAGRSPMTTPSPATRRPVPIRSDRKPMAR